ncbi:MAG: proline--tRNA ligase [Candidatus Dormibacteria bacterium]
MALEFEEGLVKEIARKSVDFDRWYTDVIRKAEVADYSPVRGCMVIRPYGWALWENIRDALDRMIKDTGHENMQFPLFIPQSYLLKEQEHVEGFTPQVAWVTRGGTRELEEPLAVRPTSEAIIGPIMRRYIHSHRDLPVLINQWANVVRWEMRTRLFLRTMEFFWQEGHTFHETAEEAEAETAQMLEVYQTLAEDWLAVPVLRGRKSEKEKFPGAVYTTAIEGLMSDGLALQMGTSHNLGQNFTRAYDVQYAGRDNTRHFPYGTSWGVSTRIMGGVFMAHGDDAGLVLPPRVAPFQVAVVPIRGRTPEDHAAVDAAIATLEAELRAAGVRVRVDRRDETPGYKFSDWELKGAPLRLEVGPRDVAAGQATLVRRSDREKRPIPLAGVARACSDELVEVQRLMLERARAFRAENTRRLDTFAQMRDHFGGGGTGFVITHWCADRACEDRVQEELSVTLRCLPDDLQDGGGTCAVCGNGATQVAAWAKAY